MSRILYYNGDFITLEKEMPQANYVMTVDGIITEMGLGRPPEELDFDAVVDLGGKPVVPGFIDSHLHMLTGALTKLQIDLNNRRFRDVVHMAEFVGERAAEGKGWIRAYGFTEDNLMNPGIPTRAELDQAIPDRPVIITRVCGHLSIVNSAALEKLDALKMATIVGGEFKKGSDGKYNGIVTEAAQQYVLDNIPAPDTEEIFFRLQGEQRHLLSKGICSIHDAGTDQLLPRDYVEIYKEFNKAGKLALRTYLMMRPDDNEDFAAFAEQVKELKKQYDPAKSRLFFGAVKLFADGSLGGRTAAVRKGYVDEPENKGLLLSERLDRYVEKVHKAGLPVAVHAIGDRAVEYCLDLIEKSQADAPAEIMHRIEHAEYLESDLIERLKKCGAYIAAQPGFIREFGNTYRKVIGDEAEKIQPLKTLLKEGITFGFGTDYPVIDADPIKGIAAAVFRRVKGSPDPLNAEEALTVEEAIKAYTLDSAKGAGTDHLQGSLKRGKFADFTVLDRDIRLSASADEMEETQIIATVVGGELLYQKKEA